MIFFGNVTMYFLSESCYVTKQENNQFEVIK